MPRTIHASAGPQPQNTAMAGPTMGAAPATEVKWWPNSTCLFVGTKSTPSVMVWAGVGRESSRAKTVVARYFEYVRYATANKASTTRAT